MNKFHALQLLWPPLACAIFVALFDWIASFGSMKITLVASLIFIYTVFMPFLIEVLWPEKRGAA